MYNVKVETQTFSTIASCSGVIFSTPEDERMVENASVLLLFSLLYGGIFVTFYKLDLKGFKNIFKKKREK